MTIPKLVAHRGYMARRPENSLSSLSAALEAGACFIEFDIQMNAEQDFIVLHDDNFMRTAGEDQSIFTSTTAVCKKISVHEPDRFEERFYPEFTPSLSDILALIKKFPAATALVEIKEESLSHWGVTDVMDRLIEQLNAYSKQCVIISFDDDAIAYTKKHSLLKTGWVLHRYDKQHYQRAIKLQADYLMCNYKKIPAGETPWEDFRHWMLYDILDAKLALHYGKLGIELIETADIIGLLEDPSLNKMACHHGV